jgi:hypothetical protein
MKATLITSMFLAAVLMFAGQVFGQDSLAWRGPISSPPAMYHHASTWEESALRGGADLVRAAGEMNYNSSLATINYQEAYSRYLDNRLQAASTHFDLRQLNREARAEARGQRATPDELTEYAKIRAPARLSAHQFDATTNRLMWPASLKGDVFAEYRAAIDRLLEARRGGGVESREIEMLAEAMKQKLLPQVRVMNPAEYLAAKRFLTSLEYEMSFAPGATTVAVR